VAGATTLREEAAAQVGLYPIVTSQYSLTTLYQIFYHIQSLLFQSDNWVHPYAQVREAHRARDEAALGYTQEVELGLGRIVALHHQFPLYTRFTNIFGASVSEATM
jgi:hypothetical protein